MNFFLFLRLLRCFNSPGYRLTDLYIQSADHLSSTGGVSPFGHLRLTGCLPPPRSLSQAATSFIVSLSQGIHHRPLLRFSHNPILKDCQKSFCLLLCNHQRLHLYFMLSDLTNLFVLLKFLISLEKLITFAAQH